VTAPRPPFRPTTWAACSGRPPSRGGRDHEDGRIDAAALAAAEDEAVREAVRLHVSFTRPDLRIEARVGRLAPIFVDAFRFLRSGTARPRGLGRPLGRAPARVRSAGVVRGG
jgi:hypothetical protein